MHTHTVQRAVIALLCLLAYLHRRSADAAHPLPPHLFSHSSVAREEVEPFRHLFQNPHVRLAHIVPPPALIAPPTAERQDKNNTTANTNPEPAAAPAASSAPDTAAPDTVAPDTAAPDPAAPASPTPASPMWGYITIGVFAGLCIIPWILYIGVLSCSKCFGSIFSCCRPRRRKRAASPPPTPHPKPQPQTQIHNQTQTQTQTPLGQDSTREPAPRNP